ncbi:MAG: tetratricopeptide repeat protein [Hyphomicrobiaceae bacterium]|nr:tetratricopeptide repeat protein [Hyphomicrobiaceae bacterium]
MVTSVSSSFRNLSVVTMFAAAICVCAPLQSALAQAPGDGQPRNGQSDNGGKAGTLGKSGKPGAKAGQPAPPPRPETPLQKLLKNGIPENSIKRARLRDNLYALLATAEDEKSSLRIAQALRRLWLTSGSDTVDLLMHRAIKALGANKADLSLRLLNAVIALAPDYAEAWNRRAYIYYKRNDPRAAAGDLRRVLALDPRHFKALEGLGTIFRESGDDANALKVFERLMDIHPNAKGVKEVYDELKRKIEGRGI